MGAAASNYYCSASNALTCGYTPGALRPGVLRPLLVGIGGRREHRRIPRRPWMRGQAVATRKEPPTFSEVVQAGETLTTLEAMRDQIAADLQACESMRDKASLYLRLADVLKTIDELRPVTVKGDAVDEIAARRAARRAVPAPRASRAQTNAK